MIKYTVLSLVVLLFFSCHSTKKIEKNVETTIENVNSDLVNNFRFIVSFYSPGNGIDRKMQQKYQEFIANNYPKVIFEKIKWGKEGEIDFCFKLNELDEEKKKQFVKNSKEILSNSNRVHIYENTPCKHKKSP